MRRLWLAVAIAALAAPFAVRAEPAAPPSQLAVDLSSATATACDEKDFGIVAVVADSTGAPMASTTGAGAPDSAEDAAEQAARSAAQVPDGRIAGVLPLRIGGRLVGYLAVAGAPNPADNTACARAGLAKFADRLK